MTDTATAVPPLRGDETSLYRQHAARLVRCVRYAVNTCEATIEDACQFAWSQLLQHQPDRAHVFGWLRATAIREAWVLSGRERRAISLDVAVGESLGLATVVDRVPGRDIEVELDAREALHALAALRARDRYVMSRHVAGLTYKEIEAEAGLSNRQVDRHMTRARKALRRSPRGNTTVSSLQEGRHARLPPPRDPGEQTPDGVVPARKPPGGRLDAAWWPPGCRPPPARVAVTKELEIDVFARGALAGHLAQSARSRTREPGPASFLGLSLRSPGHGARRPDGLPDRAERGPQLLRSPQRLRRPGAPGGAFQVRPATNCTPERTASRRPT